MALTICKACGNSIGAKAKDCTYCALIKKKKSIFIAFQIAALLLFLIVMAVAVNSAPQKLPVEQPAVQQPAPSAKALFDIPAIAGKTEAEVESLLGEPVFCAKSESSLNCSFRENEIEIVFIDGKADWITVNSAFRSPSDWRKIEGKTKAETLKLLGEPVFCVKSKSGLHCAFKDGNVSVEFIDGKVDELVVKGKLAEAAYSKDSLALLGLPVKEALFSNKQVMRWENIAGLASVTLHAVGDRVSFVTIKVKTK
ncbi:MAG: hypothetical protein ACXWFI_03330 [Methylobacter sp.]